MFKKNAKQARSSRARVEPENGDTTRGPSDGVRGTASPPDGQTVSEEAIAIFAYERWVSRGRPDGSDQDDWFEAERQLRGEATSV